MVAFSGSQRAAVAFSVRAWGHKERGKGWMEVEVTRMEEQQYRLGLHEHGAMEYGHTKGQGWTEGTGIEG